MAVNDANVMKTSSGGRLPILQDFKHGCGFIHRLDVPSSGLVLAATTYVPRLQKRVSESGMLWCWDEPFKCRLALQIKPCPKIVYLFFFLGSVVSLTNAAGDGHFAAGVLGISSWLCTTTAHRNCCLHSMEWGCGFIWNLWDTWRISMIVDMEDARMQGKLLLILIPQCTWQANALGDLPQWHPFGHGMGMAFWLGLIMGLYTYSIL